jgi:hypothetical protein
VLLHGLCQGRAVKSGYRAAVRSDIGQRVITGGLRLDHMVTAPFRARHGAECAVRSGAVVLAAEGMASLGTLSLDGTKLADNVAHKASRMRPQSEKRLAEAATADTTKDGPAQQRRAADNAAGVGPASRTARAVWPPRTGWRPRNPRAGTRSRPRLAMPALTRSSETVQNSPARRGPAWPS